MSYVRQSSSSSNEHTIPLHGFIHSFIHSFHRVASRRFASLRIASHVRFGRCLTRVAALQVALAASLSADITRSRMSTHDGGGRSIHPSIDARARRVHLFIPITLPTIPHHVPSKPFVSPCLGSRPVNQGHASHHPDRGDSTDAISDARARGGFVAQLVERALCNDAVCDVFENMCEVPGSKPGRSTLFL